MIENFLRPLFLAHATLGLASLALVLYGTKVGFEVVRGFEPGLDDESQITLERRAELAATIVAVALSLSIAGAVMLTIAADRAHDSIRGAMCAYGVLASADGGFFALATSLVSTVLAGTWLSLHRLDLALPDARLTRTKFLALLVVAPIVAVDFYAFARFVASLDFGVVASCCSVGLDEGGAVVAGAGAAKLPILPIATTALVAGTIAMLTLARHPTRTRAFAASVLGLAGVATGVPAIVQVVAPYAYENPTHRCPFCLLHAEAWGLGWPLLAALLVGAIASLSIAVVELERPRAGDAVSGEEARLARLGAIALAAMLVLSLAPIVRYRVLTGAFLPGVLS